LKAPLIKKFDALTGARWLFASFVFVYHNRKYWRKDLNKYVLQFINEMHIGVSLFFVLSGFLIAYKYNDPKTRPHFKYGKYIGLRLVRIAPLYWLLLLVSYIDWGFPKKYQTILTFSFAHGFSGIHNLDGIAQAWSLSVELTFYFLAPLLFLLWNKNTGRAVLFLLIAFAVALSIGYAWHKINSNKDEYFYPFSFVLHSTFFGRYPEFLAGIYLAGILHKEQPDPFTWIKYKTWCGFTGIIASLFVISFFQPDIFHHGYDTITGSILQYSLIPIFAVLWMYGLATEQTFMSNFFSGKLLTLLGNASFAFYLVHISYVNLRVQGWHLLPDRNFVLLWIISFILYLLFEKPVNDLFRKIIQRKKIIASEPGS
jgi:peptidoglycan/LPS O-acetylase OafA/YrhL